MLACDRPAPFAGREKEPADAAAPSSCLPPPGWARLWFARHDGRRLAGLARSGPCFARLRRLAEAVAERERAGARCVPGGAEAEPERCRGAAWSGAGR